MLRLSLACWDYDRTRALVDGRVQPEGIELIYLNQPVEETFFRMLRFQEFDASEMSLSSYVASLGRAEPPFIAIPAFPSRFFRHSCIFVAANSGIKKPEDLKGKRIGVPEYQMTAPVWIRGILSDEYGVKVTDVQHLSGGEEEPGRDEKLKLDLPSTINLKPIPANATLSGMLAAGELDALVTARAPSTFTTTDSVKRLFPDYVAKEKAYFARTKIFPIMHTVVIRRDVYAKNPWVAQSLYKAFVAAKQIASDMYNQTAALTSMLPWSADDARAEMGADWWPYGLGPNRHVLETFLRYHHEQGLSKRLFKPEELFARETLESFKV
jgi:4,5-dihydroxyphthalate decarboxylase